MRNNKLDIMKGIAIILMVMGHSGFYLKGYIYLFHMAVFFMISGYLFRSQKDADIRELCSYILRKIKGIWLPVFIWSTIYICANNFLITIGVYLDHPDEILGNEVVGHSYMNASETLREIAKAFFMVGRTELGGAFWFLTTLFGITILCTIIEFILSKLIISEKRKDIVHAVIAIMLCLLGWSCNFLKISHLTIPIVFSCYILYFSGHMIKKHNLLAQIHPLYVLIAFVVLTVIYVLGGRVSLASNKYINPICMLFASFSGWILLSWLSEVVENKKIASLLKLIGQNTLPIVIHHFWCFKFIHLIQIGIYKYPATYLAAFPYLKGSGLWWICYTVVGVAFPILLHLSVRSIIHKR